MIDRSRILSVALALWLLALPTASLAHEGHEHPEKSQAADAPAQGAKANEPAPDDAARAADDAAVRAKRKEMADEDAAKAAAAPSSVAPRGESGQH